MVFQSSEAKWMLGWGHEEKKRIEERKLPEGKQCNKLTEFPTPSSYSVTTVCFLCHQSDLNVHYVQRNDKCPFNAMSLRQGLMFIVLKGKPWNPPTIISKAIIIYTLASHFIMVHTFCIHPPGQYLEPILAAIIALSLLQYVSINPNICILISLPICLGKIAQAVRLNGDCW